MASACLFVKSRVFAAFSEVLVLNFMPSVFPSTRQASAIALSLLPRRISMIRSMQSQAFISPSWTSFFSLSLFRSVVYLRLASSYWNSTWCLMIGTIPRVSGRPSQTQSILTPNVSSSFVFLYSRFIKFSKSAPFLRSMTILMPSFEDWFEISEMSLVRWFS